MRVTIPIPTDYAKLMIASTCHLGGQSLTHKMSEYAYSRRSDKVWVFDLQKTWDKLVLAAQIIVSYKNRGDIVVVSSKKFGHKPATMFARAIGATPVTGNFVPGTFTNRSTKAITEPRLIITTDPFTDKQTICEASYINVPCISLANTDNQIELIDCVIPCNNRSPPAIGAMFFILGQLVRYMEGSVELSDEIRLKADAYFYRDPSEIESALAEAEKVQEEENDSGYEEEEEETKWEEAPEGDEEDWAGK
ncbi:small subunit ribosomal protein SAe [Nematocida homosporus]|uniref:small subunit ribosomal protein SAe n=1 Tax=Nematocida homosporus TaxID=1912981 RepID=UPI00221FA219|nr:small subunit ribosomal protein SAe [Nematocida homosporus]KAI5184892.1 small subunit ribosomal protein SAe [Nematocida homosporus]